MGRPCGFDQDEALERALGVFWRLGYEGASLDDLCQAMGIGRQSLYNTYGDKRTLFLRCLRRYTERNEVALREHLGGVRPVQRAFAALFDQALGQPDERKRMGCFSINTGMELAPRDVEVGDLIARGQRMLEDVFTEALEAGAGRAELAPGSDCRALGRFLVGTLLGVTVLLKSDPRSPAPRAMVDVALQALAR